MAESDRPLVIDADALNAFEGHAEALARARGARAHPAPRRDAAPDRCAPAEIESRRIDFAREWAPRWGAVVVLKGAPTVTASATERRR